MTLGGSYDMAGVWKPNVGSGAATVYFDKLSPYNQSLCSSYYTLEDDYYGAYGDLLEYENALRLSRDLSQDERLRMWQERLAFEELEHEQRMRRYERMSDIERQRLGLVGRSWWAGRYGGDHHHHGGWKERFGDRLTSWTSDRLPLSSALGHRFGSMGGINDSLRRASHRVEDNLHRSEDRIDEALYRQEGRLASAMREQDRYLERSLEEDRLTRRIEEDRLDRRIERDRLERRIEEDRFERRLEEEDRFERNLDVDRYEVDRQLDNEVRFEHQQFDQDRYIEDQILENRVLEDRLYDDQSRFQSDSISESRYRQAELDCYERERGF